MQQGLSLTLLTTFVLAGCGPGPLPGQTDEEGNACPMTAPRGDVSLVAYQSDAWVGLDVVGRFQRSVPAREAATCTRRTIGACEVTACQNLGIDFVNGEPRCGPTSSGALVVTRGERALAPIDGSARITLDTPLMAGERFAVRTEGADVPAFGAVVTLPSRVTPTGPSGLVAGTTVALAEGAGMQVTWAPTDATVLVIARGNNGGETTVECRFDGARGDGTVPAEALAASVSTVEVWSESSATLQAGAFPVTVHARWSTGARATLVRAE